MKEEKAEDKSKSRRIRVIMLGPARTAHSGISAVVNNWYAAGLDREVDLTYIGTMADGSRAAKLVTAVGAYRRFRRELPACDIVHVNMSSDTSYYRKSLFIEAAKKAGKKIVIHQHGGDVRNFYHKDLSDRGRARFRRICSMGDVFLVLNRKLYDFFSGILDDPGKLVLFPNTIRIPQLPEGAKHYGQRNILFLGRICREKGIGELLAAVTALREKYPDLTLTLGGVFEDEELERKAKAHADFVRCPGWVGGADKERLLKESDIFVLPSYFEGMPVSILEAMSWACAIVATDVGGIPEAVADGKDGLLCRPGDEEGLLRALERLLADPDLCKRLGQAARRKAEQDYSMDRTITGLVGIYRRLAGQ